MKPSKILTAVAIAMSVSWTGTVSAQAVLQVKNICESTAGGVNTVNVVLVSWDLLEYTFKNLLTGQNDHFAATTPAQNRKFMLPAGSYQLTYKHPNQPAIGLYSPIVVVKPYQIVGGQCVQLSPQKQVGPNQRSMQ